MFGAKIESFNIITLRETGMRGTTEYEIVTKDDIAEVSFYRIRYTQSQDSRELDRRVVCSKETIIKLLNGCHILSWRGFVGECPKDVLDGIAFTFEATVNQDKKIYARGSQNFPEYYGDFINGLRDILDNKQNMIIT